MRATCPGPSTFRFLFHYPPPVLIIQIPAVSGTHRCSVEASPTSRRSIRRIREEVLTYGDRVWRGWPRRRDWCRSLGPFSPSITTSTRFPRCPTTFLASPPSSEASPTASCGNSRSPPVSFCVRLRTSFFFESERALECDTVGKEVLSCAESLQLFAGVFDSKFFWFSVDFVFQDL